MGIMLFTTSMFLTLTLLSLATSSYGIGIGMLYPRDSESRQTKFLDGVWMFRTDTSSSRNDSFVNKWWEKELQAVSSQYTPL